MSRGDFVAKFEGLVQRFTHEFSEIEGERATLKEELHAYNVEKQKMKAINVSGEDIISLNVGGQKFTTTRSTLCQVQDSLLATMFSGRWEDGLKRDQDGAVFLDCNPQYFGYILEYLRMKRMATPENPAKLLNVQTDDLQHIATLVEYLGFSNEIVLSTDETNEDPTDTVPSDKFNLHGPDITLQEEGKVAVHTGRRWAHGYALGESIYQQGIVHLKLKLEAFKNNEWIFVGIIVKEDGIPQNHVLHSGPDSYGWAVGMYGHVWQNGSHTTENALKNLTKEGDTVELVLDCDAAKLSLHLPTGHQFHIDLPKSKTWRLNVDIYNQNDKIRVTDA
jgi:hypothetical protein